jgi:hypothetical protein
MHYCEFKLPGFISLAFMQQSLPCKGRTSVDDMYKLLLVLNTYLATLFNISTVHSMLQDTVLFSSCTNMQVALSCCYMAGMASFRHKQIAEGDISKLLFAGTEH